MSCRGAAPEDAVGGPHGRVDGTDLFALVNAISWIAEQAPLADRRDRLLGHVLDGLRHRN